MDFGEQVFKGACFSKVSSFSNSGNEKDDENDDNNTKGISNSGLGMRFLPHLLLRKELLGILLAPLRYKKVLLMKQLKISMEGEAITSDEFQALKI